MIGSKPESELGAGNGRNGSRQRRGNALSPTDPAFADLLLDSYQLLLGKPLVDMAGSEQADADWLYTEAPFCLLAHDGQADPRFIYANKTAQACFEYSWDKFVGMPSRLSAEQPDRAERQRLLDAVTRDGFVADYRGIRIAKSGRRFRIDDAVIWNLVDRDGVRHGQAAVIRRWSNA